MEKISYGRKLSRISLTPPPRGLSSLTLWLDEWKNMQNWMSKWLMINKIASSLKNETTLKYTSDRERKREIVGCGECILKYSRFPLETEKKLQKKYSLETLSFFNLLFFFC